MTQLELMPIRRCDGRRHCRYTLLAAGAVSQLSPLT